MQIYGGGGCSWNLFSIDRSYSPEYPDIRRLPRETPGPDIPYSCYIPFLNSWLKHSRKPVYMEHLNIWEMCVFSTLFIFLASKDYVLLYVNFFWGEVILYLSLFFF